MNDTFNLNRFSLLFKKTLFERPVQLLGLLALTLASVFITYGVVKTVFGYEEAQNISFILGLVGGGSFLATYLFNYFSSNASGSAFLTLPASQFEKWICAVLLNAVLFPCIFLLFFRLVDVSFVSLYRQSLDPASPAYKDMFDVVTPLSFSGFAAQKTFIMFVNFAGAMLLGSLYFNKVSFIKVALIICGLFLAAYLLDFIFAKMLFDKVDKALPFYCVFIPVGNEVGKVMLPEFASKAVDISMEFIVPGLLWGLAYIRLREKEF